MNDPKNGKEGKKKLPFLFRNTLSDLHAQLQAAICNQEEPEEIVVKEKSIYKPFKDENSSLQINLDESFMILSILN